MIKPQMNADERGYFKHKVFILFDFVELCLTLCLKKLGGLTTKALRGTKFFDFLRGRVVAEELGLITQ